MSLVAAALWSLAAWFAVAFVAAGFEALRAGAESDLVTLAGAHVLVYSLVLFALLRVYGPEASIRDFLGLRRTSPVAVVGAILLGAGSSPILNKLGDLWMDRFPSGDSADDELQDKMIHAVSGGRITLIVVLGIVLPLVYEFFFRGAIYGSIRRRVGAPGVRDDLVPLWALVASTVLFAGQLSSALPLYLLLGLGLGWIRQTSGSLVPVLFGRVAFALVPLAPLFLGRSIDDDIVYPRGFMPASIAVAVLGGLLIVWTAKKSVGASAARSHDDIPLTAG
jgi:hypothetical protein